MKKPIIEWKEFFEQIEEEKEVQYRPDYNTRMIISMLQNKRRIKYG